MFLADLSVQTLKFEEDLENAFNNPSMPSIKKIRKIKECIANLVMNELILNKFNALLENNNKINQNENG